MATPTGRPRRKPAAGSLSPTPRGTFRGTGTGPSPTPGSTRKYRGAKNGQGSSGSTMLNGGIHPTTRPTPRQGKVFSGGTANQGTGGAAGRFVKGGTIGKPVANPRLGAAAAQKGERSKMAGGGTKSLGAVRQGRAAGPVPVTHTMPPGTNPGKAGDRTQPIKPSGGIAGGSRTRR